MWQLRFCRLVLDSANRQALPELWKRRERTQWTKPKSEQCEPVWSGDQKASSSIDCRRETLGGKKRLLTIASKRDGVGTQVATVLITDCNRKSCGVRRRVHQRHPRKKP